MTVKALNLNHIGTCKLLRACDDSYLRNLGPLDEIVNILLLILSELGREWITFLIIVSVRFYTQVIPSYRYNLANILIIII
jgi:hypothetical protein